MNRTFEFGSRKYSPQNYLRCTDPSIYIDAALRHIVAQIDHMHHNIRGGEYEEAIDPDSGLPHLTHATASLLMALEIQRKNEGEKY